MTIKIMNASSSDSDIYIALYFFLDTIIMSERIIIIIAIIVIGLSTVLVVAKAMQQPTRTPFSFDNIGEAGVARSEFQSNITKVTNEMVSEMNAAKTTKTVDERIAIATIYNDQIHELHKGFIEWSVRHGIL